MSANPIANGGLLRKALEMPDFRRYAIEVKNSGITEAGNVPTLGPLLRDVMRQNRITSACSARTRPRPTG